MGHAAHFLTRLQRLRDDRQLELALALYRDPAAVRACLAHLDAPPAGGRVAIALSSERKRAHAIVTVDGRFVTCLGPGMQVHAAAVLPYSVAAEALAESERIGHTKDRLELRGGVMALFERLLTAGPRLAREDFEAAFVLAPAIPTVLWALIGDTHNWLAQTRRSMTARERRRTDRRTQATLRRYEQRSYGLGHLLLLLGALEPETLLKLSDKSDTLLKMDPGDPSPEGLTASAFALLDSAAMLRAAWLLGYMGPPVQARLRRQWRSAPTFLFASQAAMGLVAIAVRHPIHRTAILNVLADHSAPVFEDEVHGAQVKALLAAAMIAMHAPEPLWELLRELMADHFGPVEGGPMPTADDLQMSDVGPWMLAMGGSAWAPDPDVLLRLGWMTVWVAEQEAADLYFPAAEARELLMSADPARARESIRLNQEYYGRMRPAKQDAAPRRNDPCPCGSGRKYKRCCLHGQS